MHHGTLGFGDRDGRLDGMGVRIDDDVEARPEGAMNDTTCTPP